MGVVIGSINVSAFLTSLAFGTYADSIGAKFLVVSGAFLVGGCTFLFGYVHDIDSWIAFAALSVAIRFVMGVGEGAFDTTAIAVTLTIFPASTATVWSIFELAAGLGTITGPPVGGFLHDTYGFLVPFIAVGLALLLSAALLFYLVPNVSQDKNATLPAWRLLKIVPIVMACLAVFWNCASFALLSTSMPVFLKTLFDWSPTKISTAFVANSGTYAVGAVIFGQLTKKVKPRVVLIGGMFCQACGMLLVAPSFLFTFLEPKPWCVYVGMVVLGIAGAAVQISAGLDIIRSAMASGYPNGLSLNGCCSGLVLASTFLSQAAGSPAGGALTANFGFRHSTSIMAFCMLTQALATLVVTIYQSVSIHVPRKTQTEILTVN